MTTTTGRFFTLSDFDKLAIQSSTFTLPACVLANIAYLNSTIEVPDFPAYAPRSEPSRVQVHSDRHAHSTTRPQNGHRNDNRNRKDNTLTTEDWELMRSFKTTKMDTKIGVEKTINDIRVNLNKMSLANYNKQRDTIMSEISNYAGGEIEDLELIATAIFDIASGNKFFSELYAELYRELVSEFGVFSVLLSKFVDKFSVTFNNIEYVDADEDYDGFCRVTKMNDKRKAITTFIANVMKKGLVSTELVLSILCGIVKQVHQYIEEDGRIHQIEEISENIFLLVSLCSLEFRELPQWNTQVVPIIDTIIDNKIPKRSMSNRVLFKFMDMVAFTK